MKRQVWCSIIDENLNSVKPNKGLMFLASENFTFDDLIKWAYDCNRGYDKVFVNREKEHIIFKYSNPIFGSRYETLYFKGVR